MWYIFHESHWGDYKSVFQIILISRDVLVYQEYILFSSQVIGEVIARILLGSLICNPFNIIYTFSLVRIMAIIPKGMVSVTSLMAFAVSHGIGGLNHFTFYIVEEKRENFTQG